MALLAFQQKKAANATPAEAVLPADVKPLEARTAGKSKGRTEETPAKEQNGRHSKREDKADKLMPKDETPRDAQQPKAKPDIGSRRRATARSKEEAPKDAPPTAKLRGKTDSTASNLDPKSSEATVKEEQKASQDKASTDGTEKAAAKKLSRSTFGQVGAGTLSKSSTAHAFWTQGYCSFNEEADAAGNVKIV